MAQLCYMMRLNGGVFGMTNWIGQQLGDYRLVDLIGQGSFADVYLGEYLQQGSYVAIKVLQVHLDDEDAIEQFQTETRQLARLAHPHIIRMLDAGVENGIPFLVMDYAAGGTLRQRHPVGTRLPLPRIIAYVNQIAAALQYAHEQKLIHRDVKPGNMFIGQHDTILLGDFGLALGVQGDGAAVPHDIAGSVPYMAPEQLAGQPCYASDQYSLAAVVYEWLCGVQPFYDREGQPVYSEPLPLRERVPGITPAVEEVVLVGLAPEPSQRFASIQAFAIALEQAGTGAFFDPGLLAHTPEPEPIPPAETVTAEQETQKTDREEPAITLLASAEMSLAAKTIQMPQPATNTANPITIPPFVREDWNPEKLVPPRRERSTISRTSERERARTTVNFKDSERKSSAQASATTEEEPGKKPRSILAGIILVVLILVIISGIFAAIHLFM